MESKGKVPKTAWEEKPQQGRASQGGKAKTNLGKKGGGKYYHQMKPKGKVPKTTWGKSTIGRESPKLQVSKILITNIVPF